MDRGDGLLARSETSAVAAQLCRGCLNLLDERIETLFTPRDDADAALAFRERFGDFQPMPLDAPVMMATCLANDTIESPDAFARSRS